MNITLNDSHWFTGTITHFNISCEHCNLNDSDQFNIRLQDHVSSTKVRINTDEPTYDLKPTYSGIYGQQYNTYFRTEHKDLCFAVEWLWFFRRMSS